MTNYGRPTFAQLLDWLEGRLPEEEAVALSEQVELADEKTRADLAWIRSFLEASTALRLARPPDKVRDVLRRRFDARAETRQSPDLFQRFVAALTYDSNVASAAAGIRSAASEGLQRQFIFTTEVAEVALNVRPRSGEEQFDLLGQVFPLTTVPLEQLSIQLLQNSVEAGLTTADDLGEFSFPGVQAGDYEVVVSAEQFEIVLKPVHLYA